mgnify:FL=1|jgi:malate dehydrogenase (oxaloacetate-decarboxylating)
MDYKKESLILHKKNKGKIEIVSKVKVTNKEELSLAYSPGVAEPCLEIKKDREKVYDYTSKGNLIAVISDGTAVLGLGDIGPEAALPVIEGKAILFKEFANIDAMPIVLDTKDTKEIIETIKNISKTFSGINLEDISAPRCFEIERELKKELDIPVFHDDQHGTAIIVLAGIINSLEIVKKKIEDIKIIINGSGAAGIAIAKLLILYGAKNIIVLDSKEAINKERENLNESKLEISNLTNPNNEKGKLNEVIKNSDIFIGVSAGNIVSEEMIESMNKDPIVFALANPTPEIDPDLAKKAGARIVATGRSDYKNQINNVLAFPGIFRGILDGRGKEITEEMKIESAIELSNIAKEDGINEDYIIPDAFDKRVVERISKRVQELIKA